MGRDLMSHSKVPESNRPLFRQFAPPLRVECDICGDAFDTYEKVKSHPHKSMEDCFANAREGWWDEKDRRSDSDQTVVRLNKQIGELSAEVESLERILLRLATNRRW